MLKILQKNLELINCEYILNFLLPDELEPMLCSNGEEVEWENSRVELLTDKELHIVGGGDWQSGVRVKFNIEEGLLVYDSWETFSDSKDEISETTTNPSPEAMELAQDIYDAGAYTGDGDSLDPRSAAFKIDEFRKRWTNEL